MDILNTYQELDGITWLLGVPGVFGTIGCMVYLIVSLLDRKYKQAIIITIIGIMCILSFKFIYMPAYENGGYATYHEVMITDKLKVDPFKYQIIEQRGKITIIKELHIDKK